MFDFIRIGNAYRDTKPVFIIGAARSGTTILWRILQKHSSFRTKESNLVETSIFAYINQCDTFSAENPDNLFRFMLSDQKAYNEFLRIITPIRDLHRWIKTSKIASLLRQIKFFQLKFDFGWRSNLNDFFILNYFHFAQQARGCKRLLEKSPNNINFINELLLAFPNSLMIYIYRHPVEVFASYKKRLTIEADADWCDFSVHSFIEKYQQDMNLLGKALNMLGNKLLVFRYEDFTANPAENYQKICDFLGEKYEAEAISEEKPDLNFHIDPHLFGNITTKTKDWQKYVTVEEAILIEDKLHTIMENYGYQRFTN